MADDGAWDDINDEDFHHAGAAAGEDAVGGADEGDAAGGAEDDAAGGVAAGGEMIAAKEGPLLVDAATIAAIRQQTQAVLAQCSWCHLHRVVFAWMVWSLPLVAAVVLGDGTCCAADD
ncbi:hypothetical protein HXX76_011055 [Chlamydomonas incerta]|uniref:Uncharacterized protein n=1 Tax=Chlamydomonas incerta TaxID=51695 RepID=A0A835SQ75_CHLIN|nr:hypothetical protein HXX76_011055 [Chlamydomonas incerta]|eukprot:KAG2429287.1 hypothetical protein HXX76_011055 [Chlamydomonas incerta]